MGWIAAAIVLVALVYFTLRFPEFRQAIKWLAIIVVSIVIAVVGYSSVESYQNEREREQAKNLIPPAAIDISQTYLTLTNGIATIQGRIRNKAVVDLASFQMKVQIQDCRAEGICDITGEGTTTVYQAVPAGQVRLFNEYITFSDTPPPQNMKWTYQITDTIAKLK